MYIEIVESLDNVPENERDSWTEVDGKFQRDAEVPDVNGLKSALAKEREAARLAKENLAKYGDIDPKKYAELLKAQEESLPEKDRNENALKKLRSEIDAIKQAGEQKVSSLEAQLKKFHTDKVARSAAIKAGVNAEDLDDVLYLTERNRSLNENGDIIIIDNDGDPTGQSIDDFFSKDFKKAKPKYFPGIPGGGGTPPGDNHGSGKNKTMSRDQWDKLDGTAQFAFVKDGGTITA